MPSAVEIANMALAEISAAPIQSFNEDSLEAREVRRFYAQSIGKLLEPWDWSFANRRAALAALFNDLPLEWRYAYALPGDISTPIRIVPTGGAGFTYGWAGSVPDYPYAINGGILYTNVQDAVLEYGASDLSEDRFPALFVDAVVYELAARLCMPIRKSREMKGDLIKQAETAKDRARADDANRQPLPADGYVSEAIRARQGWGHIERHGTGLNPGWIVG